MKRLFFLAMLASCSLPCVAADRIEPSVDLAYLGAFRVPTDSGSSASWGRISSASLNFNPSGNGGSGSLISAPCSLTSSSNYAKVTEFTISDPVISTTKSFADLNVSSTLHDWVDVTEGLHDIGQNAQGGSINQPILFSTLVVPSQGTQLSDKIYWMRGDWFTPAYLEPALGMSDLNWTDFNAQGPWLIHGDWSPTVYSATRTGAYMGLIPQSWADTYMPGYIIGVGQNKINPGDGSYGATLFAVKAWETDSPSHTLFTGWSYVSGSVGTPTSNSLIDSKCLLYPGTSIGHRRSYNHPMGEWDTYSYGDSQNSFIWIDNTTNAAIIFSGQYAYAPASDEELGVVAGDCSLEDGGLYEYYTHPNHAGQNAPGMVGYPVWCEETCAVSPDACPSVDSNNSNIHGDPYVRGLWFYNPDDLGQVALGNMEPWEPQPYAFYNVEQYWFSEGVCNHMGGIAYDPASHRIYVMELAIDPTISGYDPMAVIHVFSLSDSASAPDTTPPTKPTVTATFDTDHYNVSWTAATDNTPVIYIVKRNGLAFRVTSDTSLTDYNYSVYQSPYTYTVDAHDIVNNVSSASVTHSAGGTAGWR